MRDFPDMAEHLKVHRADFPRERGDRLPTAFVWRDPSTLPPRPWVYGQHLIRKQVSVTVAPGGVGKSSLTICEALAMASGRELLGDWTAQDLKVWIYNLEDPRDEMDRRIIAAMQHHDVAPDEIHGRLFVDTGRERELCTAIQTREGVQIIKPELDALAREIEARGNRRAGDRPVRVVASGIRKRQRRNRPCGEGMGAAGGSVRLRNRTGAPHPQDQWRGSDDRKRARRFRASGGGAVRSGAQQDERRHES